MTNETSQPEPSGIPVGAEKEQHEQGTKRRVRAKSQAKLAKPEPKNLRSYEPLIRHCSRTADLAARQLGLEEREEAMLSFYINYLLNNPKARKAIGLKHSPLMSEEVLNPYVRFGFTGVPDQFRDDYRKEDKARLALSGATSAWLQHLKRNSPNLKQITVFIERDTYKAVQDFRKKKITEGLYGHGISQDGVIEYLLKAGIKSHSPLAQNAATQTR